MKKLLLLVMLSMLTACAAPKKVNFNEETALDQQVKNPAAKEDLKCGDKFEADFTNTDSTFGTLEVINKGVCKVKVLVSELVGGAGGAGTRVAEFEVDPKIGNITAFSLAPNQKFHLLFTCVKSTGGQCAFSYRFSTGKEAATPTRPSPDIDASPPLMPEGPESGNLCITQNGKEATGKVISNLTKGQMQVNFKAKSTCKCNLFTVLSDAPEKNNQDANAGPNAEANGVAFVPAGKTIILKAKCGPGALSTEKCSGVVENIKLSLTVK